LSGTALDISPRDDRPDISRSVRWTIGRPDEEESMGADPQAIEAGARVGITFAGAGTPMWFQVAGLSTNPPTFFDGGRSMYFLYSPWPADYVRAP